MSFKKNSVNKSTLDKLSENSGALLFNGSPVGITPSNKTVLDSLSESNGALAYKGTVVATSASPTVDPLYAGLLTSSQTFNLYDKSRLVSGTHHDPTNGNVISGGFETHAISVKPKYTYVFNKGDGISTQYSFYDSTGAYISGGSATKAVAPVNAATLYVYITSTAVSDILMVMESNFFFADYVPYSQRYINPTTVQGWFQSKWFGKNWWVLGDSISTGWGDGSGAGNQYATKPYSYLLGRNRFIKVQNDAVSGYTVGNVYNNKVVNMPPTANAPDLITIMIGTNDHGFNTTIGAITDTPATSGSFYAVYKQLIETVITNYPNASIGLITPIQRNGTTNGNNANAVGKTLRDYCDAVVGLGKNYSLPVLDWYYSLGFSPYNTTQLNNFYCGSPSDGTHPNDKGHTIMAGKVGNFIESL